MLLIVTCVVASVALILAICTLVAALRMRTLLPSAAKWSALKADFGDLSEAVESLQYRLRRLSSKIAMRAKRESEKSGNGHDTGDLPDSTLDPEGWKAAMNARIAGIRTTSST